IQAHLGVLVLRLEMNNVNGCPARLQERFQVRSLSPHFHLARQVGVENEIHDAVSERNSLPKRLLIPPSAVAQERNAAKPLADGGHRPTNTNCNEEWSRCIKHSITRAARHIDRALASFR